MDKFKLGDRVRLISGGDDYASNFSNFRTGDSFIVVEIIRPDMFVSEQLSSGNIFYRHTMGVSSGVAEPLLELCEDSQLEFYKRLLK